MTGQQPTHPTELPAATEARYEVLSHELAGAAIDGPRLFRGPRAVADTSLLTLSVAWHEGHLDPRVELGLRRGDNGESWCHMQRRVGRSGLGTTPEGWTGHQLIASPYRCFLSGLNLLARARFMCIDQAPHGWLMGYFGACGKPDGLRARHAVRRWAAFVTWRARYPLPDLSPSIRPLVSSSRCQWGP